MLVLVMYSSQLFCLLLFRQRAEARYAPVAWTCRMGTTTEPHYY
jgi:hypothetical protein